MTPPGLNETAPDDLELDARVRVARPVIDPIAHAVMRARAADALFGRRTDVRVGRYALVRSIGIGGGGAVFEARDPELDRDVAVKLIEAPSRELRARALAEGQALARLAHPNVVPVFDVGESDDRVYLVMELVRGVSLRAYAGHGRSLRAVLRACRQAGEGLAAAHAAGLVHRDFKPDNAVVGADDRVRVIDFGLAVAAAASTGSDGTPAYMAPEQRDGTAITEATDQFAFGVSLREISVTTTGIVPRWLQDVIDRATAADPASRYSSMTELLRALANDPRARWRRRAWIAAPVALAAIGIAGFAIGRTDEAPGCDAGRALASVWSAERATQLERTLVGLATPFAITEATRTRSVLGAYAARWIATHDAGCVAQQRHELTPTLLDRRIACLDRARIRIDATVGLLERSTAAALPGATRALAELPDLARCADPAALIETIEPPPPGSANAIATLATELERVRVGVEAATPDTIEASAQITSRARVLGYRPLLADALLVEGRAAMALDQVDRALAPLDEAGPLAMASSADAIAVEAYARRLWVRARTGTAPEVALADFGMVAALAERLRPRDLFARALLFNNGGVVELAASRPDVARAHLQTALALAKQVTGPGEVELAFVRSNLALTIDDARRRHELNAEATTLLRARLGDDHPMALDARAHEAFDLEDPAAALAGLRDACTRYAAFHPSYVASIAECSSELGWLALVAGDHAQARTSFDHVLAAADDEQSAEHVAIARAYLAVLDGDLDAAVAGFERARPVAPTQWWELLGAAESELGLAYATPGTARGRAALERAIALLTRGIALQRSPALVRRLAWATAAR